MSSANANFDESRHQKVYDFFELLLRAGSEFRLEEEYPLVFSKRNVSIFEISSENSHILGEENPSSFLLVFSHDGQIRAGFAVLKRKVKSVRDLQLALVGSVVTSPEERQKGLQRILFRALEDFLRPQGVDLMVLWSNQVEFYQKLGFQLAGLQATWQGLENGPPLAGDLSKVQIQNSDQVKFSEAWFEAFQRKMQTVQRSAEEMKRLFQIPGMRVASTASAYALMGKGEDFQGICHEWAGPAKEVSACIEKLRQEQRDLRILTPGFSHVSDELEFLRILEARHFESRLEYLGLFKALQGDFVMEDLGPERLKLPFFIWGLDSI